MQIRQGSFQPSVDCTVGLRLNLVERSLLWPQQPSFVSVSKPDPLKAKCCTLPSPCKIRGGIGEISESIFRQIIYAVGTCVRFRICCSFSERFKGDWSRNSGRKSTSDSAFLKSRGGWARCLGEFYQFGVRPIT